MLFDNFGEFVFINLLSTKFKWTSREEASNKITCFLFPIATPTASNPKLKLQFYFQWQCRRHVVVVTMVTEIQRDQSIMTLFHFPLVCEPSKRFSVWLHGFLELLVWEWKLMYHWLTIHRMVQMQDLPEDWSMTWFTFGAGPRALSLWIALCYCCADTGSLSTGRYFQHSLEMRNQCSFEMLRGKYKVQKRTTQWKKWFKGLASSFQAFFPGK